MKGLHYIWLHNFGIDKECLAVAELEKCDTCGEPCTVNALWIQGGASEEMKHQATRLKERFGLFTEMCVNDEGDCLCEKCYQIGEKANEVTNS